jgi:hypothetical protein
VAGVGCDPYSYYSPFTYSPYGWDYGCTSFGYGYYGAFYSPYSMYSPYGYGTGFGGWYAGGQPVVIVVGGATAPSHGHVVNGHGYSQGGSASSGTSGSSDASGSKTGGSPPPSSGASSATPARTAVPRKP